MLLAGDIVLGGDLVDRVERGRATWVSPFDDVLSLFRDADVRVGNLECPLFRATSPCRKKNLLYAPAEAIEALTCLDFNALSMANNHITDQTAEGIEQTHKLLATHRIQAFGAGTTSQQAGMSHTLRVKGKRLAMLGYAVQGGDVGATAVSDERAGCTPFSVERAEADLAAVRRRGEDALVSIHWGYQFDELPSPDQISIARRLIDAGATIVHGHHPHVLQGFERYRHGVILYSLGNFFFPSFHRADGVRFRFPSSARQTGVAVCTVGDAGVESCSFVPLQVSSSCRVRLLRNRRAALAHQAHDARSQIVLQSNYAQQWQHHHNRTMRWREHQEARLSLAAQAHKLRNRLLSRNIVWVLQHLRFRHLAELFRLCMRHIHLWAGSSGGS